MMGALSGGALRQLGRGNEPPAADSRGCRSAV